MSFYKEEQFLFYKQERNLQLSKSSASRHAEVFTLLQFHGKQAPKSQIELKFEPCNKI